MRYLATTSRETKLGGDDEKLFCSYNRLGKPEAFSNANLEGQSEAKDGLS